MTAEQAGQAGMDRLTEAMHEERVEVPEHTRRWAELRRRNHFAEGIMALIGHRE